MNTRTNDLSAWIEPGITGFNGPSRVVTDADVRSFKRVVHTIARHAQLSIGPFEPADNTRTYCSIVVHGTARTPPELTLPSAFLLHSCLPVCATVESREQLMPPWSYTDFGGFASIFPPPLRLVPVEVLARQLVPDELAPLVGDGDMRQIRYWHRTSRDWLPTIGDAIFNCWD